MAMSDLPRRWYVALAIAATESGDQSLRARALDQLASTRIDAVREIRNSLLNDDYLVEAEVREEGGRERVGGAADAVAAHGRGRGPEHDEGTEVRREVEDLGVAGRPEDTESAESDQPDHEERARDDA